MSETIRYSVADMADVQHYVPASLIGQFSSDVTTSRRGRRVYVARRNLNRVLYKRANDVGKWPGIPHLYDAEEHDDVSVDPLWMRSEQDIGRIEGLLAQAASSGSVSGEEFVISLAPYVAQLMARCPLIQLGDNNDSDLIAKPNDAATIITRHGLFGVLADALVSRLRWAIVTVAPDPPMRAFFTLSDNVCVWLPGRASGSIVVPLSGTCAVVLSRGQPSYRLGAERVSIPRYQWRPQDVQTVNDIGALQCDYEIYSKEETDARHVVHMWAGEDLPHASAEGIPASALANADRFVVTAVLLGGRAFHFGQSWLRFMVATHQFGCDCAQLFSDETEEDRAAALGFVHQRRARMKEIMRRETQPPGYLERESIFVVQDKGLVAYANQTGLHVMPTPNGEPEVFRRINDRLDRSTLIRPKRSS